MTHLKTLDWLHKKLKHTFPLSDDWLLEGLAQTCVASNDKDDVVNTMVGFLGENAVVEAVKLSEELFEKKKDEDSGDTATVNAAISLRKRREDDLKATVKTEAVEGTTDVGFSKLYRKEKKTETQQNKQQQQQQREHRSVLIKTQKKKTSEGYDKKMEAGDSIEVELVMKRAVNCLACGKIFRMDKDASGEVACAETMLFLKLSGKCTFCEQFVCIDLCDGTIWNGDVGYVTKDFQKNAESKEATKLKDELVFFDRSGASRTKVIDDQSEWYDHADVDAEAWLAEDERRAMKNKRDLIEQQNREREQHKKRTFGIDILGRKTLVLDEEELRVIRERDERAKLAMQSAALNSFSEFAQGGGSAIATANESAKELQSRITSSSTTNATDVDEQKVRVPKNKTVDLVALFVKSFKDIATNNSIENDNVAVADNDAFDRINVESSRVLDVNPFDLIAAEARDQGDLGFV